MDEKKRCIRRKIEIYTNVKRLPHFLAAVIFGFQMIRNDEVNIYIAFDLTFLSRHFVIILQLKLRARQKNVYINDT